jgi:hypothetical protein
MRYLIGLVMLAAGCGGSDDPDAGAVECEQSDRSGTYFIEYETVSGNCGDLPSALGRLDDANALPDGCSFDAMDRWSDGDCKLERAYTCPGESGGTIVATAVSTQQDDSGDNITGTATMTLRDADGATVCVGTYRFKATRQ